ncbi:hypothetical protein HY032_03375 [Candidatus Gottesmanbacteria bacterium]|nr:hypothetical protein [Candidatus Gottesmanbacteria bacterium]
MTGIVETKEEEGTMDKLRVKIKETLLFTDPAKIELLARLQEIPQAEQTVLEDIVDRFDREHRAAGQKLRKHVTHELQELQNEAPPEDRDDVDTAVAQMHLGMQILTG